MRLKPEVIEVTRKQFLRRGARVAESGGLENRCTLTGTVGSNPTLSASYFKSQASDFGI